MKKRLFYMLFLATLCSGCIATVSPGSAMYTHVFLAPGHSDLMLEEPAHPMVIVKHPRPTLHLPLTILDRPTKPHLHSRPLMLSHTHHGPRPKK